ncbi:hypothetical protein PRZ48_006295 [Zasmidium cellare]|uniref:FAS1 domain-containing protein n=1 Tax=Zasmidium cellare TaxID=395010 RepID=A0ABR0EMR8_ZASCE|nr:hypothetical protein PRZ48_006295 [Zasmidium cellare]
MQFKTLITAAAVAGLASAQSNPSLAAALNSTSELSSLNTLLGQNPDILSTLANQTNITVFAPSNSALDSILNSPDVQALQADGTVAALLTYHVLNGTVFAQNITSTPTFAHTLLSNETYSNVTGGQVVGVRLVNGTDGGNVTVISGFGQRSNVVMANVNVTNGVVHVIDQVLTIPGNVSSTALAANLTALAGALQATNLTDTLDSTPDITVFAPTNAAFEDIGSALANLTVEQATQILGYHVINGSVAYSSLLSNGSSVDTLAGPPVNITIEDGEVFVNSARVIAADILVSGGVVHVIDSVLNPNSTLAPNPDEDEPAVAYSGASSGAVPYTSGITAPTATTYSNLASTTDAVAEGYTAAPSDALSSASASAASSAGSSSSSAGAAMPTGAIGAAALFGGAAWLANL